MNTSLNYGNWIRKKLLIILGLCTSILFALIFLPLGFFYRLLIIILFLISAFSFLFPLYAYFMFSQEGGKFQEEIYALIIRCLGNPFEGEILDIGSGNGVLSVSLAQYYTAAQVSGLDYWGKKCEYSKRVCEENAQIGRVVDRVHFQKGDTARLKFEDSTFDAIVSNLTFHEVLSALDKSETVREALRVLKPGGRFAFVDYFYDSKYYGSASEFRDYLGALHL